MTVFRISKDDLSKYTNVIGVYGDFSGVEIMGVVLNEPDNYVIYRFSGETKLHSAMVRFGANDSTYFTINGLGKINLNDVIRV